MRAFSNNVVAVTPVDFFADAGKNPRRCARADQKHSDHNDPPAGKTIAACAISGNSATPYKETAMEQTTTRRPAPLKRPEDVAWLIDADLNEMPGMRLTFAQVKRLWSLSDDDCRTALDYLVSSGRLWQGDDGRLCRSPGVY